MPKLRHMAPCCNMRQRGRVATGTARLQQTAATGCCNRQRVQLAPPSAASVRGRSATMAQPAPSEHRIDALSAQPMAPRGLHVRMRYGTRNDCSTRPRSTLGYAAVRECSESLRPQAENARCIRRGGGSMAVGSKRGTAGPKSDRRADPGKLEAGRWPARTSLVGRCRRWSRWLLRALAPSPAPGFGCQ
jgi:hypothetical protein